jgi:8-oxo-dGTP pyrophosphatase MutT (NUDIX family)
MSTETVSTVVLSSDLEKILLQKRRDFRVWSLPGGHIEREEIWEAAAIRETLEETGYIIAIDRHIGNYWQPQMPDGGNVARVYTGHVIENRGFNPNAETVKVKWFPVARMPLTLLFYERDFINDAILNPTQIIEKTQRVTPSLAFMLRLLIKVRRTIGKQARRIRRWGRTM